MDKAVLDYYIKHADEKFAIIQAKLESIDQKIEILNSFKWKVTGMMTIIVVLFEVARMYIDFKGA